jgi:YVTN family beta-propeller protein
MGLGRFFFPLLIGGLMGCSSYERQVARQLNQFEKVTAGRPGGRIIIPVNQVLTPLGIQVELPGMRPQAIALRPDGKVLATSGKTSELVLVNPETGDLVQRILLPSEQATNALSAVSTHILKPDDKGQLSYTGLIFSRDGKRIYLSNVNGSIKLFALTNEAYVAAQSFPLPPADLKDRKEEIPAGLALSADGKRLYVAANLSNRLLELDAEKGTVLRAFDVGVAPYDVVLAGNKAYVSNWGGRRPDPTSVTGPAGQGTTVRVDPVRFIASEGSVTVIDLASGTVISEILVGLHSSAMALSPSGRHLAVANAGSDTVSIIDTGTDRVVETISLRWQVGDPFGATPNALAFAPSGKELFVCNGAQNAIAVIRFRPRHSKITGLIPTGWFPGAIACDNFRGKLHVANIKGFGSGKRLKPGDKVEFNSHQYFGSLSLIELPTRRELARATAVVLENMRQSIIRDAFLPPRPNQPPRPVPERVGEPSVFKHVIYIIKENRTYDQVLGDMREGNGNPQLCIFGEKFTPNQHKIAREFVLLDNTYCSGILSADGHNWSTAAFATDYLEKSFAGWPRSYPDGMDTTDVDALAYSPAGFIWDNVLAHGKTVRSYGEFAIGTVRWKDASKKEKPAFKQIYDDFVNGTGLIEITSEPAIESLRGHMKTNTIGWSMYVPDVFRASQFIQELKEFERNGNFPNLSIICLPNNHTSGTDPGMPTPGAHVADNDLAFGQIIEAVSKSRFWTNTCILAIEDDPQNGWDHVSGYRTTAFVVSPYTKRGAVIGNNYNQTGLIKTIELILGLPPLNQLDASASPMSACFTDTPDFTPYTAVPNRVPLDELNPPAKAIADPLLRHYAAISATLPLHKIDACPEDLLNRILWHAQRGSHAMYPAWALTHVPEEFEDEEKEE